MAKRGSVCIASKDNGQFTERGDTPSWEKSFESNDIDWDRCFICQLDSDKPLQSSNDSRTVEPTKANKELGDYILQYD